MLAMHASTYSPKIVVCEPWQLQKHVLLHKQWFRVPQNLFVDHTKPHKPTTEMSSAHW